MNRWHGASVLVSETESCLAKALNWTQLKEIESSKSLRSHSRNENIDP